MSSNLVNDIFGKSFALRYFMVRLNEIMKGHIINEFLKIVNIGFIQSRIFAFEDYCQVTKIA